MRAIDPSVGRCLRQLIGGGCSLGSELREWIEQGIHADFEHIRIHADRESDKLARHFGADAFTVGSDIFFKDGCFNPGNQSGLKLFLHEIAHVLEGSKGGRLEYDCIQPQSHPSENAADGLATLILRGDKLAGKEKVLRQVSTGEALLVQCHASWEHRLIGDFTTTSAQYDWLSAVADAPGSKATSDSLKFLSKLRDFAGMWRDNANPSALSIRGGPDDTYERPFSDIQTVRLRPSDTPNSSDNDLTVTYGDLAALPDYIASPADLGVPTGSNWNRKIEYSKEILLGVLQSIRQETYNKIRDLIASAQILPTLDETFDKALVGAWSPDLSVLSADLPNTEVLWSLSELENRTASLGKNGVNHYQGILARNACHFAPCSWYRWRKFHRLAIDAARRSSQEGFRFNAKGVVQFGTYAYDAWIYSAFADHFLQDSFAAGHLINKTLVMQWFVEWAAQNGYGSDDYIPNWGRVSRMTTAKQSSLGAASMYNQFPDYRGVIQDPQTGQELDAIQDRINASGVQETDVQPDKRTAYFDYLYFLSSTVVQASTSLVHDYFNTNSLWVNSLTCKSMVPGSAFQIWGDNTMLSTGKPNSQSHNTESGIYWIQHAQAISLERLAAAFDGKRDSEMPYTEADVMKSFPTEAGTCPEDMQPLAAWHRRILLPMCTEGSASLFTSKKYWFLKKFGKVDVGRVSVDQGSEYPVGVRST